MQKVLGCFQEWLAYSEEPMEDITGEKEIKMAINPTLNIASLMQSRRHHKIHENFHFRSDGLKIVGKEDDVRECNECHLILPMTAFTAKYLRIDGAYHLKRICRQCHVGVNKEQREARKNAPPKPDNCDNCHKNIKLEVDHIHGTTKVRGWLCSPCNRGIGSLGDNLEGVLRGATYLEKDKSKIIKILEGIK